MVMDDESPQTIGLILIWNRCILITGDMEKTPERSG
jgi:hypothetical protein